MSTYDIKSFFAIGDMSIISMISQYFKEANSYVCMSLKHNWGR